MGGQAEPTVKVTATKETVTTEAPVENVENAGVLKLEDTPDVQGE